MHIRHAALIVLALGTAQPSPSYYLRYLPLDEKELRLRVPQKKLANVDHALKNKQIRVGSTRIRITEERTVLSGVDQSGNPWKLTTSLMQGGSLWQADLDKNGLTDLILAKYTGGNGLAPSMHLMFIMFDSEARPVPWQVDGYFETDEGGVKDLLDFNQDGRAQLVRQSYDDGYWITSLYETRDAHWRVVHGPFAGHNFPLHTRFTNRTNRTPTAPMPGRSPTEDDLSNDLPEPITPVTVTRLRWVEPGDPLFTLSDDRTCQPVNWYGTVTVVVDRVGRRDASTGHAESRQQLLDEVFQRRLPVVVGGSRRNRDQVKADCIPEWLWADDRQGPVRK